MIVRRARGLSFELFKAKLDVVAQKFVCFLGRLTAECNFDVQPVWIDEFFASSGAWCRERAMMICQARTWLVHDRFQGGSLDRRGHCCWSVILYIRVHHQRSFQIDLILAKNFRDSIGCIFVKSALKDKKMSERMIGRKSFWPTHEYFVRDRRFQSRSL
ncbi:hypothetical protein WK28_14380 [Burkholderia vietnamiensis]|nr:hypothetical protein WK28_14380 [Burkholderia vietnamiensis]